MLYYCLHYIGQLLVYTICLALLLFVTLQVMLLFLLHEINKDGDGDSRVMGDLG